MIQQELTIINKLGLHARAAAKLAGLASRYGSKVQVQCNGRSVDAKSVMALMLLAASQGTPIALQIDGPDEDEASEALCALINDRFGEGE